MTVKQASQQSKPRGKPHATLAYHVLRSSVEETLAAIKGDQVKTLPKKDILLLQQTASALLGQIALCLRNKENKGTP